MLYWAVIGRVCGWGASRGRWGFGDKWFGRRSAIARALEHDALPLEGEGAHRDGISLTAGELALNKGL